MSTPNELRVFISSTFRDLQEEREHLVKKIFPEIRALCRERGITFAEIDLRWGITEEESAEGRTIRTCLEEIDRCRPYFIGITGDRYGYVPGLYEYTRDPELLQRWPWIEQAAIDAASITDLEIRHGVLNSANDPAAIADNPDRSRARFFFRAHANAIERSVVDAEVERLEELKLRVRTSGFPVAEFRDPPTLGVLIHDALVEIIDRDFADARPATPLEKERSIHEAFAASRRRGYVANPTYVTRLDEWFAEEGNTPLILHAESGSGKSSLLSYWCEAVRQRFPKLVVIEHYVGIGSGDTDHLGIIRHVMEEIKELCVRDEEVPSKPDDLESDFANWLGFATGERLILVIDGINQLTGRALELHWLPPLMPDGVKLIISTTVEQTLVALQGRGWLSMGIQPLTEAERGDVVVRFLADYSKALSPKQVTRIATDAKSALPLFLRTMLEELRIHGTHEELDQRISTLLASAGTDDLFQRVLERMEIDFSHDLVRTVMTTVWASKSGLSEEDLEELSGAGRLSLSALLIGMDYHLVRRDGLMGFFHDYLRRAVATRYLLSEEDRTEAYDRVISYFQGVPVTLRSTRELLHGLELMNRREELEQVIVSIDRFELLWRADEYEVLRLWSTAPADAVAEIYRRQMAHWTNAADVETALRARVAGHVAELCNTVGAWSDAEQLFDEQKSAFRSTGDRQHEALALTSIATVMMRRGRLEEAEQSAREAKRIARELDDLDIVATSASVLGQIFTERGDFTQALLYHAEHERIARLLGERGSIAVAVGNTGLVHTYRGEYSQALQCYAEQEQIARAMGNRRAVARVAGNRGLVHWRRGDFPEALESFAECEQIARDLGNRTAIAAAVGNRGLVHANRGEYSAALECYDEQERIERELGDRRGISLVVGNRGLAYFRCGEHQRALACFAEQEQIAQEMGDRTMAIDAVGNRGLVLWHLGDLGGALTCFIEHERIARELGDYPAIASAVGNRAIMYALRGEFEFALTCYEEQERIARELGDRDTLAIARGNRGAAHHQRGEHAEALACYKIAADEHHALGNLGYSAHWRAGIAEILVSTVERKEGEAPPFLLAFVRETESDASFQPAMWRSATVTLARNRIESCMEIFERSSQVNEMFRGRILLARIAAADGNPGAAIQVLNEMLAQIPPGRDDADPRENGDDMGRADLHYWLWRIGATDEDHRTEALRLYRSLYSITEQRHYQTKIEELEALP